MTHARIKEKNKEPRLSDGGAQLSGGGARLSAQGAWLSAQRSRLFVRILWLFAGSI